jgi:hypothetical protein
MRMYLVFHVSLLKKINQNVTLVRIKIEDKIKYKIKQILKKALIKEQNYYLIK